MKTKLVLPIMLILLVGIIGFVLADMTLISDPDTLNTPDYEVDAYVFEGWNLIAGPGELDWKMENSEVKKEDILAVYAFIPPIQDYALIIPEDEMELDKLNSWDDDQLISSAMWVYSTKPGRLRFGTEILWLKDRQLYSGWNFFSITPEVLGNSLWEIKGTCDIEKAYGWDSEHEGGWGEVDLYGRIKSDESAGMGIVIKVSSDCKMATSEETSDDGTNPPGLPGDYTPTNTYDEECVDTDEGLDYYTKGATYYGDYDYGDNCVTSGGVVNAGTPQEYTLVEGNVIEYACYGPDGDKRCSTSACRFIQYECPNGCENGACI